MTTITINRKRLEEVMAKPLLHGKHSPDGQMCVMEAPGGSAIYDARRRRAKVTGGEQLAVPGAEPLSRQGWNTDHWETPWPLVKGLEDEFEPFQLDPCATAENHKAPGYWRESDDGLKQSWYGLRTFCNPPYSTIDLWIHKAVEEQAKGTLVVMLLPVRTDRDWWHDLVQPNAEVRFLRGRQRFIGPDGTTIGRPVFASAIAIFRPRIKLETDPTTKTNITTRHWFGAGKGSGGTDSPGGGHPVMFGRPKRAVHFDPFPDGGGYPIGFVEWALKEMGASEPADVLHLCAGSVVTGLRVDVRSELNPDIVADCRAVPLPDESVDFILADPPYSVEMAENLYGTGKQYPQPGQIVREACRLLRPGGRFGLLHVQVPMGYKPMRIMGVYGVTTGSGYNIRAWTLMEKGGQEEMAI